MKSTEAAEETSVPTSSEIFTSFLKMLKSPDSIVRIDEATRDGRGSSASYGYEGTAAIAAEIERLLARVKELEEGMTKLMSTSQLLLQNAEGCAVNHYGNDFQEFGPPGWLVDCENDIVSARSVLLSEGK